eukprot:9095215-Prorocentrum_lima.AAC.1
MTMTTTTTTFSQRTGACASACHGALSSSGNEAREPNVSVQSRGAAPLRQGPAQSSLTRRT